MKLKKTLALVMAIALMGSALSACSSSSSDDSSTSSGSQDAGDASVSGEADDDGKYYDGDVEISAPGEFPIVVGDEPVTISVFTAPHTDANSDLSYGVNEFTTYFQDLTNVAIEWEMTTAADKTAKLNLLFQTDNYPDVILNSGWTNAEQYSYGEQGFLISLNDYYDTQAYYFDKAVDLALDDGQITQNQLDSMVMPDGNIYSIYGAMTGITNHTQPYKLWIYEPWLEALDLDMPTTTDELTDVLMAFKTEDPNGNGIADEIPLAGSTNGWNSDPSVFILNAFTYYSPTDYYMYINDGEVTLSFMDEGLFDGIVYLRELMDAGLLYEDSYVQDNNTLKTLTTGDTQLVGSVPCAWEFGFTDGANGVEGDWTNYVAVTPIEGPDGAQYSPENVADPSVYVNITDNCEYPIVAFKLFDAIYDDVIGRNVTIGMEDQYWSYADEGTVDIFGGDADFIKITAEDAPTTNYCWGALTNTFGDSYPGVTYVDYAEDDALNVSIILGAARNEYMQYAPDDDMVIPPLLFNSDESADVTDLYTVIKECYDQFFVDMLYNTATEDLEERWEQFLSDLDARDVEYFLEIYQTAYDEQY